MHILLTGVAGFIGSQVARQFLDRGDRITGIDNFNDYYDPAQKRFNAAGLTPYANFELFNADIRDRDFLNPLFAHNRFDAIVHLAGYGGVRNSILNPGLYFEVNLNASLDLLELARNHRVENFVFASTSSVYGRTKTIPFVESDPCDCMLQPYAASKRAVEQFGCTYHERYGLNFTSVRFFTVYGPSGRPDMMPAKLAESILYGKPVPYYGDKYCRDWTFVEDIARGVVAAVDNPLGYEIINLGRGQPQSLRRFIELMESEIGGRANLVRAMAPSTEITTTFADLSKARRSIGYSPEVNIEDGIRQYCAWFTRHHKADPSPSETIPSNLPCVAA